MRPGQRVQIVRGELAGLEGRVVNTIRVDGEIRYVEVRVDLIYHVTDLDVLTKTATAAGVKGTSGGDNK